MSRIAIVGSGSWGTALALSLARRGDHSIVLWSHASPANAYLPGFSIPPEVTLVRNLDSAAKGVDLVITAVPSQHLRTICGQMAGLLTAGQIIVSATKGLED